MSSLDAVFSPVKGNVGSRTQDWQVQLRVGDHLSCEASYVTAVIRVGGVRAPPHIRGTRWHSIIEGLRMASMEFYERVYRSMVTNHDSNPPRADRIEPMNVQDVIEQRRVIVTMRTDVCLRLSMASRQCVAKAFRKDSRGGAAGTAATTGNGRQSICELQRRTPCHGRDPLHDSGPSRSDPSWNTGMGKRQRWECQRIARTSSTPFVAPSIVKTREPAATADR